ELEANCLPCLQNACVEDSNAAPAFATAATASTAGASGASAPGGAAALGAAALAAAGAIGAAAEAPVSSSSGVPSAAPRPLPPLPSASDFCPICWVEPIAATPAIRLLSCGHVVHVACSREKISQSYPGPEISFAFLSCPLHPTGSEAASGGVGRGEVVLHRLLFFLCSRCHHPYFGGDRRCGAGPAAAEPENEDVEDREGVEMKVREREGRKEEQWKGVGRVSRSLSCYVAIAWQLKQQRRRRQQRQQQRRRRERGGSGCGKQASRAAATTGKRPYSTSAAPAALSPLTCATAHLIPVHRGR
ncbi:unnamed protein product, partial [Closterium sp. NIES-54]